MTTPRSLDDYGGEFTDALPVENPEIEQAATYYNRHAEDVVQLTQCPVKAVVRFDTRGSAGTVANVAGRCQNGTGSSQLPTVTRSAAGTYVITYSTTWTDTLSVDETVSFYSAKGAVEESTTPGHVQCSVATNVITVYVMDPTAAYALSDLGGDIRISVWLV